MWSLKGTEASKPQHSDDFNGQDFPRTETIKVMSVSTWGLAVPLTTQFYKLLFKTLHSCFSVTT